MKIFLMAAALLSMGALGGCGDDDYSQDAGAARDLAMSLDLGAGDLLSLPDAAKKD